MNTNGKGLHVVSSGVIGELATGFGRYTGVLPRSCTAFAERLFWYGDATGGWGKNHDVPDDRTRPSWTTQDLVEQHVGLD